MDVIDLPLGQIIPYARNPRRNEKAVATVAASIAEFGWRQPIVVDEQMVVLAGHTRLEAARQLELETAPVHVAKGLTEAQARAYRLMDNRSGEDAAWDDALLGLELGDLMEADFDVGLTGFTDGELDRLLAEAVAGMDGDAGGSVPPLTIPEPPRNPASRTGDLWILGDHRLLCGDSTSHDDVRRLMNGERAVLFATDPPYLVDYDGSNHPTRNKDWSQSYGVTWDDSSQGAELYDGFIAAAVADRCGVLRYRPRAGRRHHRGLRLRRARPLRHRRARCDARSRAARRVAFEVLGTGARCGFSAAT